MKVVKTATIETQTNQSAFKKHMKKTWRQRSLYILLLPSIISTIIFCYLPIYGLTLAFKNFNAALGPFRSQWADPVFYNFWFFQDREFWYVIFNTLRISVVKFIFSWPAPIILALLLNEVTHSGFKRIIQTLTYLPHFISWVIMAGIIYKIFDFESTSPIKALRSVLGFRPVALMGNEAAFIPLLVVTNIIKEVGWGTIIYLAAIMGIDPQLYEAAIVDGAGKWTQVWYITLPGMVPTISILLVLALPGLLSAGFDQIYNLMNPMVAKLADVTDIYVLRVGLIKGEYAYATALGLIFSILGFALTMTANRISKGSTGYGIW